MDVEAFKKLLSESRKTTLTVGNGLKFHVEMPTDHAFRVACERNKDEDGRVMYSAAFRVVLDSAITGWDGVSTADLLVDAPAEALPFSRETLALFLDCRQDIADELGMLVGNRLREQREKLESARKN